jgi:hypothetical protein
MRLKSTSEARQGKMLNVVDLVQNHAKTTRKAFFDSEIKLRALRPATVRLREIKGSVKTGEANFRMTPLGLYL